MHKIVTTIRSRFLFFLLPPLLIFLILISYFFYFNWSHEISNSFKARLQSLVVSTAQFLNPEKIEWLIAHFHDPSRSIEPATQNYRHLLKSLQEKQMIANIYLLQALRLAEGNGLLTPHPLPILLEGEDRPIEESYPFSEYTFSPEEEHLLYLEKKGFVTHPYTSQKTHARLISAYAPVLNRYGEVIAILGADMSLNHIDHKLKNAFWMILISASITLALIAITVFFIADRMSQPVRRLNQAALEIAAGNYEANIQVKGPKEITELAHTLNTMSECLVEYINRLQASSLVRERVYGEYECALLLQYHMLQKVAEDFHHPHLSLQLISFPSSPLQKGLLFKIDSSFPDSLTLWLIEAQETGFSGLFHLNQSIHFAENREQAFVECHLSHNFQYLRYRQRHLPPPLIWSTKELRFMKEEREEILLSSCDMIFLYTSSLLEQFQTTMQIEEWLSRVLRHFSEDGLETIHTMLTNELNFLAKKQHVKPHTQLIAMQIH